MTKSTIRPGLTAATRVGRALLAAGWRYDSTTPMAGDSTERTMLHPSGREISARTTRDGDSTSLTMTGLSLEQVAGAVTGAGLAPAPEPTGERAKLIAESDSRQRLAAELHRIADDIAHTDLPLGEHITASLHLGVVKNRADLDRWASRLGSPVRVSDDDIPAIRHRIRLGGMEDLRISVQSRRESRSELERLRARIAELEAKLAQDGAL